MHNIFKHFLIVVTLCVLMTSCDPMTYYNYIVSNNSSQDIYLILYPDARLIKDEDICRDCNSYCSNNGFSYIVSLIRKDETDINYPLEWVCLKPGESIQFTHEEVEMFVNKNPEYKFSGAIWIRKNCIQKILIGDNLDQSGEAPVCDEKLSKGYWSNSSNWIIQNKKYDSIDYWLVIDDEVIREHSVPYSDEESNSHRRQ